MGATGGDVRQLQRFLNAHGFAVASTGAGSPGNETEYFGSATRAALVKFQAVSGITPSVGYFGPKTRNFIDHLTP
ncbi:MAG: peptidoglycan-binding domain-containing protein [Minisyncoccota bacterium]